MTLEALHKLLPFFPQAYSVRGRSATTDMSGKMKTSYRAIREPLPDSLFEKHFMGQQAISVQVLLGDGETCQWGALDIDQYGGGPELLATIRKRLTLFQIPAFVEQSKSGGAHVYFLLDQPVMARPFRRALRKLAVWIGFPNAEVRPAQDQINAHEGDLGTMMILPGFGIGVLPAAQALAACQISAAEFNRLTEEGDFIDGPPCLFPLQRLNEAAGEWSQRNLFLYQLAVLFRYKYPADWQDRVRRYNETVITPSLPENEVQALLGQLEKNGKCHYICKNEPFLGVCNKAACQMRRYGIAARESAAGLLSAEGITVLDTDPPTWFVTLEHPTTRETVRIKLTTAQLQNVSQFKKRCLEVLKVIPTLPSQKEWEAVVANLLEKADVIPVPFEMTENARILDLLYRFALTSIKSTDLEGLLRGRVYVAQGTDGGLQVKFRLVDFTNFLERYKYRGVATKDIYSVLQELATMGKLVMERLEIPPLSLDVWSMAVESRYLELKIELDIEDEV